MLNLDTHILLFALADELKPREKRVLSNDTWSVSAIVVWEICKLAQLGRIGLDVDDADFRRVMSRIGGAAGALTGRRRANGPMLRFNHAACLVWPIGSAITPRSRSARFTRPKW